MRGREAKEEQKGGDDDRMKGKGNRRIIKRIEKIERGGEGDDDGTGEKRKERSRKGGEERRR